MTPTSSFISQCSPPPSSPHLVSPVPVRPAQSTCNYYSSLPSLGESCISPSVFYLENIFLLILHFIFFLIVDWHGSLWHFHNLCHLFLLSHCTARYPALARICRFHPVPKRSFVRLHVTCTHYLLTPCKIPSPHFSISSRTCAHTHAQTYSYT